MPRHAIGLGREEGGLILDGDPKAFKLSLEKFTRRYIKDSERRREIVNRITKHPFVRMSERETFFRDEKIKRYKNAKEVLDQLIVKLEREEVRQIVPSSVTAQRYIAPGKLKKHGVELILLSENQLLISLERHPHGGKPPFIRQYWAYDSKELTLTMVPYAEKITPIGNKDGWKVSIGNGRCEQMANVNEDSFYKMLKKELSPKASKNFQKEFNVVIRGDSVSLLEQIPKEVSNFCKTWAGIDLIEREKQARLELEKIAFEKFGEDTRPPAIYLDPESISAISAVHMSN